MAIDKKAYALANDYTDETVIGGGAIKGKNCTISKIEDIDGGHRITFGWTLDNGTTKSQTLDVKDGVDGHTPVKGVDYYDGEKGEPGIAGLDGKDGTTYTPSIGEVTTVESNVEASASVSVNTETKEAVFNFAIPKGEKGIDGVQISDNETVENKTWSSKKTSDEIAKVDTELNAKLDELSTYSTEETKVGTWVDGKPVYEKTVFSSFTNYTVGEYTTFAIPFGNINVISIDGMINYDSTFPVPVNYNYEKPSDNNIQRMSTFYSKNSGSIITFVYSSKTTDYNNANYFVTVRYTKPTD